MAVHAIKVPDIGEGIAEVELVEWRIQPGDTVREDQVLADVMTDKATVEIPSPVAGTVVDLGGRPGELLAVGADLVRIETGGGTGAAAPAVAQVPAAATSAPPAVAPSRVDKLVRTMDDEPRLAPEVSPVGKPLASPAVRRRARELGIELAYVHGSGPGGRIGHADLDVYLAARGRQPAGARGAAPREKHGEERVPVVGLRRRIAQKMQEAKRRIPHFSYVEEVDVTDLEALRALLNAKYGATRGRLTLLPFIARAVVLAVADHPVVNARYDDDAGVVTRHEAVHLGIAAQTDAGLVVPVLRHAEAMDPWTCAREIARLADAARTGKAARDELTGSTLTLTSLGPLGGLVTTPVINHPEVAIVGVNRIVERPVFQGDAVVRRSLMNLSSSFDHRVVDGMDAARFIQAVKALLEAPALLFID